MNSHDLEAFAAVVETGSIVGASRRLHLTQPGISRRVQSLEESLGTVLLDRQSKPLRATVDGRRAYEMARRVLTSIAELRSTVGSETDFVGELRLGVSPFLADQVLAAPFEDLHRSFPRLMIRVTNAWSADLMSMVQSGTLDAAVVALTEGAEPLRQHTRELLAQHALLVVASPKLGLPRRPSLQDLASRPWIMSIDGCGMRAAIRRAFEGAGLALKVAIEAPSAEFRLSLVARGVGLGITSRPALDSSPLRDEVCVLEVSDFSSQGRYWLIHHATGRLLAPLSVLKDRLIDILAERRPSRPIPRSNTGRRRELA
jgi:DNA-binding transcriptional LysR family regulator